MSKSSKDAPSSANDDVASMLAAYKLQRSTTKANITRIKSSLEKKGNTLLVLELESWLELINSYIKNLMAYQTEIEKLDPSDQKRSELEELCIGIKSLLKSMLGGNRRESLVNETLSGATPNFNKLPALKMPKFSGKYAEYKNFIASFNSLVHNDPSLSTIQKFNHLVSCLTDDALRTIKAFQVNEDNYQNALDRLAERFDNKCLIFQELINSLFSLEKITKPNASSLRQIVDNVSAVLDSLSHLGSDKDVMHALVVHLVMSKVDSPSKIKWDEQQDFKVLPKWEACAEMLIRRCQFLEINEEKRNNNENSGHNQKHEKRHTRVSFSLTKSKVVSCLYCSLEGHTLENCSKFLCLTMPQRFSFVKKNGFCINCLNHGHMVTRCSGPKCKVCSKPHHFVLHRYEPTHLTENKGSDSQAVIQTKQQHFENLPISDASYSRNSSAHFEKPSSSNLNRSSMHMSLHSHQIILATAVILVQGNNGQFHLARALLDSCSQVNLIRDDFAQKLYLKREHVSIKITGVGDVNTPVKHKISTLVKSRVNNSKFVVEFCIVRSVARNQPEFEILKNDLSIPHNVQLADPWFNKPGRIDLLLGCEYFFDLLSVGQIQLCGSLPIIQKTVLGWIVSGKYEKHASANCLAISDNKKIEQDSDDYSLHTLVHRFWELEEIPHRPILTEEHSACEKHFVENTIRLSNGRFVVKLPFKCNPLTLGSSFDTAQRRFLALERRLSKTNEARRMYNDFMQEYLHLNHMEPVSNEVLQKPHYVIPHQCVLRPHSTTTKLRVVFDASCKTSTQTSLNDVLMVGPTIQNELFSTLLRFRLHKFAIAADVTKMYRQVLVSESDTNFQLILWRESIEQPIQIYRLKTVTYGTASAPFLAVRCLKEIAKLFEAVYPLGSSTIINDFYVDDLISGAENVTDIERLRSETSTILGSCGFILAKWFSNIDFLNDGVSEKDLLLDNSDVTRALGLIWDTKKDLFACRFENNFGHLSATKRNILSISSRLFDPLGLLAPLIIRAKVLLQELWKRGLAWDESIPQALDTAWFEIKKSLIDCHKITIPRYVNLNTLANCEIVGFADASNKAYGCCIYLRSEISNVVTCRLLTAKSKVSPLKLKSLPRLELCAAHLLAKLWQTVKKLLPDYIQKATFWSDSEIVLHWLRTHPSSLSTFVGNRISEIQDWTEVSSWRHVPSNDNPADIVSRGCDTDTLIKSIWFTGPEFLYLQSEEWPKNDNFKLSPELISLEKKKSLLTLTLSNLPENSILQSINHCSSYTKALRIISYVLRAVMKFKGLQNISGTLTANELDLSFLKLVELLQNVEFAEELKDIRKEIMPKSSIKNLSPFVQEYEDRGIKISLLRVGGRLLNAPIKEEIKFPLLLKKNSHFVTLYLEHLHKTNAHAGAKMLVALTRERIWLVNARSIARKTVRSCVICARYKPKLLTQIMGHLPKDRLLAVRPFWICGVDLCGPVYTTMRIRGRPPVKTYVAVFVCFATKAVHLETVSDLMTESFLSSLSRFVGRRGLPKRIWCDNATNFIGAANRLSLNHIHQIEQRKIVESMAERGVEFQFIPPRAPHFGGLWEAAVKSAKYHLIRTTGRANLTLEELNTVLVEVEAILNSRPIVPVSNDPCDGEAITPGHFLIGSSIKALPDPNLTIGNHNCLKRFQALSCLKARFWSAWEADYILQQQQKMKWAQNKENVEVGNIVTVHEDNAPPQTWLLGRVVAVEKGKDGKVRVAEVKTKNGTLKRPIHKLAPLPVLNDTEFEMLQPDLQPCKAAGVK